MTLPDGRFNNQMLHSYLAHDHDSSAVAASKQSDICHGNVHIEPDH